MFRHRNEDPDVENNAVIRHRAVGAAGHRRLRRREARHPDPAGDRKAVRLLTVNAFALLGLRDPFFLVKGLLDRWCTSRWDCRSCLETGDSQPGPVAVRSGLTGAVVLKSTIGRDGSTSPIKAPRSTSLPPHTKTSPTSFPRGAELVADPPSPGHRVVGAVGAKITVGGGRSRQRGAMMPPRSPLLG
jgi:hypothetical protein